MEKNLEEIISNDHTQFTSQTEKENQKCQLFLKNYKHKNTVSYFPTKLKKVENNILSLNFNNTNSNISNISNSNIINTNNNLIKANIKSYENKNSQKTNNLKLFSYKRRSTLVQNISNISMNQNNISNSINLKSFFKINNQPKKENINYLPLINCTDKNYQNETSFKSKNSQEKFVKINLLKNNSVGNNSEFEKKKPKNKLSVQNINILNKYEKDKSTFQRKKVIKMKTILNLNKQFNFLANEMDKEKEKQENNIEEDEENDEQTKRDNKGLKNKKLLYSKKFNNYIFKIYKAEPQNKNKTEKKKINPNINNVIKTSRNQTNRNNKNSISTYLTNFNPNIYIKKIKNKIKNGNLGNSEEIKSKILKKASDYIDNFIFKNKKPLKKKYDILEKIKDKNIFYVEKERKELVNKILHEMLLKIHFRHKKTIFQIFIDNLIISQFVKFNIFLKLNIIRHVLVKSEKDENIYFINLIKHLLYPKDQIKAKKYVFIKNIEDISSNIVKRTTTVDRFIEINKKDIYYIYFSIKFQLLDCETIIHLFENKKFDVKSVKKVNKASCASLFVENKSDPISEKESEDFSEVEKRMKKMSHRSKHAKRTTYINKIRFTNSSKIINLNLTKNIISLRNTKNIRDILRNKTSLNLNKIQQLYNQKLKKSKEFSDNSSDSFDYKKYSKKLNLSPKKLIFSNHSSEDEDDDEIHQRDKITLFEHFLYFTKYSEFDKLLHWFKKSGKYLDLNYKMDNGDTLLHLCVRFSLPLYIYKYLIIHGVNINGQNNDGETALHLAVQNHKYKIIDFLIKMGASEYVYNKNRKSCWECL